MRLHVGTHILTVTLLNDCEFFGERGVRVPIALWNTKFANVYFGPITCSIILRVPTQTIHHLTGNLKIAVCKVLGK